MKPIRLLVSALLALALLLGAGCGGPDSGDAATFTSPHFGYSIAYDRTVLSEAKSVYGNDDLGPERPEDWPGPYVRHLLYGAAAAETDVENVALSDAATPPSGIFISASRRAQRYSIDDDIEFTAIPFENLFHGRNMPQWNVSASPSPAVTDDGLRGFRVVRDLKGVHYEITVLFGRRDQFAIILYADKDHWDNVSPTLKAALESFRAAEQ